MQTTPAASPTDADSVTFTVTFSEPVTGVDPTDFQTQLGDHRNLSPLRRSPPRPGSGIERAAYAVTRSATDIVGDGTMALDLVDNNSIRDLAGNELVNPADFQFGAAVSVQTTVSVHNAAAADFNGDGKADLAVAVSPTPTSASISATATAPFRPGGR